MLEQLKEDIEQYQEMMGIFDNLQQGEIDEAFEYSKQFLLLADRWSEIALNSSKYCVLVDQRKTDFYNWAYQKYRLLLHAHDFTRVVYRQGKEDLRNGFYNET